MKNKFWLWSKQTLVVNILISTFKMQKKNRKFTNIADIVRYGGKISMISNTYAFKYELLTGCALSIPAGAITPRCNFARAFYEDRDSIN